MEADGDVLHIDAVDLEGMALLQLRPGPPRFGSFDGVEVAGRLTVSDIRRRQRDVRASHRQCPVILRRAPFGKQNRIPERERGWVCLERFLTMVCTDGSRIRRKAAQQDADHLKRGFRNLLAHAATQALFRCLHRWYPLGWKAGGRAG